MSLSPFPNGTHRTEATIGIIPKIPINLSRHLDSMSEIERDLMEKSLPTFQNAVPGHAINTTKLRLLLSCYGTDLIQHARDQLEKAKAAEDQNEVAFNKLKEFSKSLEVQLQEARADAKAAAEGRGIHENKRLTEMSAALEAKSRALASMTEANRNLTFEVARLKNELTARAAVVTAYEREKNELMGAAVITAEKMQTAAALLGEAKHDLDERYGDGIAPFLGSIKADIMKALGQLTTA